MSLTLIWGTLIVIYIIAILLYIAYMNNPSPSNPLIDVK